MQKIFFSQFIFIAFSCQLFCQYHPVLQVYRKYNGIVAEENYKKAVSYYISATGEDVINTSLNLINEAQAAFNKNLALQINKEEASKETHLAQMQVDFALKRRKLANAWRLLNGLSEIKEKVLSNPVNRHYLVVRRNRLVKIVEDLDRIALSTNCAPLSKECNIQLIKKNEIVYDWSKNSNSAMNWCELLTIADKEDWYSYYDVDFIIGFTDLSLINGEREVVSFNMFRNDQNVNLHQGISLRSVDDRGINKDGLEKALANELCYLKCR